MPIDWEAFSRYKEEEGFVTIDVEKDINAAIKQAFKDTTITIKTPHLHWWNLRIHLCTFLIRIAMWVVGANTVHEDTPSSVGGGLS